MNMGTATMKRYDAPVYDKFITGEVLAHEKIISVDESYSYRADDWRNLSDNEFYLAIMARAKDARNRPRKPWRVAINEVFNNPKRRCTNA